MEAEDPNVFYGKLTTWSADDPDVTTDTEWWGTPTDVAAGILAALENEDVEGFVIGGTRGAPEGQQLAPRKGDPRDD